MTCWLDAQVVMPGHDPASMEVGRYWPMTCSGSQVAICGKTHKMTIATTMHSMKGKAPFRMVVRRMSGLMPLMTNRFIPTDAADNELKITDIKS